MSDTSLRIYNITVPLRYYTYDIQGEQKQSEFVMGLKEDIRWQVDRMIEESLLESDQVFRKQEPVQFCLSCGHDPEMERIPLDFFTCRITNIVAHDKDEARALVKPDLYRTCRTLSFLMSIHNCNKHSYQPRVEPDMDHAEWTDSVYEVFEQALSRKDDSVETMNIDGKTYQVITLETAAIEISTSVYMKIYGRLPVDEFQTYTRCKNLDVNYMLDEFYLALGQENMYSKFFHLFSIIEFVEKRYESLNGSNKLFQKEEITSIIDTLEKCPELADRERRDRLCSSVKQMLGNMTNIGRKEKLVQILWNMDIVEIKNCGTMFSIDAKTIGEIIELRNKFYHGDRQENDKKKYIGIDLAVTRLMYICERIIKWAVRK